MSESGTTYIEAIGRRKRAAARVRLYQGGSGSIKVNDRNLAEYLPVAILQEAVKSPLVLTGTDGMFDITVHVKGGGIHGQADAIRMGIARSLVDFNPEFRAVLRKGGFLSRDARRRERKKPGLKSARRAAQFSKR
ncbi:30S ribosomal protein S9 [Candidatus Uhrbacteria bacterium CG_4_9_14_3_um_filter_50_9]|uniref:Small ribosomal subunit protein uS9 n=1 Tax=Candidatus Uhrbacteria bacterium CG_4_9_14_3_um_filter_50_9 TaxID=1975035 RepID=A0A2M7XDS0_9BACT|nr:MAG: 30S ribosomal protein S9 [Candidatus Uhrbacteria bacterium CG_4_9_14_3_um_filter_50_9]